jgi:hypothetical protein
MAASRQRSPKISDVLGALVGVVDESWLGPSAGHRHLERVDDQLCTQVGPHRPTDDPAGEAVDGCG